MFFCIETALFWGWKRVIIRKYISEYSSSLNLLIRNRNIFFLRFFWNARDNGTIFCSIGMDLYAFSDYRGKINRNKDLSFIWDKKYVFLLRCLYLEISSKKDLEKGKWRNYSSTSRILEAGNVMVRDSAAIASSSNVRGWMSKAAETATEVKAKQKNFKCRWRRKVESDINSEVVICSCRSWCREDLVRL
mgnify:CR=1 FL=1